MKKILCMLFFLFILMMFVACENDNANSKIDPSDVALHNLPHNLFVDFDLTTIESIEQTKVYTADFIQLDPDFVTEQVLQEEVVATETYATGPWFETEGDDRKEYLTVYDGGEAFGINGSNYGGLTYSLYVNGVIINYDSIVLLDPMAPNLTTQLHGYNLNSDYQTFVDLEFLPYAKAEEHIKQVLASLGIMNIGVETVYALDQDTMNLHYERYLESMRNHGEERPVVEWSKEDEAYLFFFRQVLDDIPLFNIDWQTGVRNYNEITETSISVIYNKNGIVFLNAHGIYEIMDSSEEQAIISGQAALNQVIEHYSSYILTSETTIETMELCYIGLVDGELYQLIPAWIFRVANVEEWAMEGEPVQTYDDYSYHVISALSGERIQGASDRP